MKSFNDWMFNKVIKENNWEDISEILEYLLILRLAAPELYQTIVGGMLSPLDKAAEGIQWLGKKVKALFSKAHGAPLQKAQQVYAALDNTEKRQLGIATRLNS